MKTGNLVAMGVGLALTMVSATAMAEGDPAKGEKVFKKCQACHTIEEGGKNKIGPNLFGVVGREAAKVEGFKYSSAMADSGLTWDEATLDQYLTKPRSFLKGTKMSFAGIKKEDQRADLIAYLATFK
ncbi:c-type cytochrome [Sneathiella chinensis]|uniref:Cytochrome c n=1 Tax=Sneathiella chinensis TaxID=349750 RepID=A0ABQ5U312_9PROT|nr:cytochrome c family protein [Sneathiella chinensis]GLQ05796.1 cytochrome c [Sneathiella chinensis]